MSGKGQDTVDIFSFQAYDNFMRSVLLSPFNKWVKWSLEDVVLVYNKYSRNVTIVISLSANIFLKI